MANQRSNGKKEYDFAYFERMNQKQAQKASPPRKPNPPPANNRQQPAKRNRDAARPGPQEERYRKPAPGGNASRTPPRGQPPGSPPPRGRPADPRAQKQKAKSAASQPKAPPRPKKPPKPAKPPKPPKPKKPKPSLSPEQIRKRRRRNRIIFTLSLFVAVVTAGVILSLTVLFPVTEIMVTGESRYTQEEIVQASKLSTGGNLFTTDTSGAAEHIGTALPYIGSVKVSHRLPGTLVIQVEDVVVAGAVQYGDGYLVLGSNGKALEQVSYLPENCPSIVGVNLAQAEIGKVVEYADPEQTKLIESMSLAAEENEFDHITQIDITDPYNVKMVYDDRITLKFGLPTDLDYKIRFAQRVLGSEISSTDRGTLNLSLARELSKVYFETDYTVPSSSTPVSSEPSSSEPSSSQASSAVSGSA